MSIKTSWQLEDQPVQKLINSGCAYLTTTELIAIILNTGSKDLNAHDLAKLCLNELGDLTMLSKSNISDLKKIKGIGDSKAASIIAAFELGRRRQFSEVKSNKKIETSKDAYDILHPLLGHLAHEEFRILLLNRANKLIKIHFISLGGVTGTIVDPKIVFKAALDNLASAIGLAHNHPSGNIKPSKPDIAITKKLIAAGNNLDIRVLDHLIISDVGYYSFIDEGII